MWATRPPAGRRATPSMLIQLLRSALWRRPGSPLMMPSRRRPNEPARRCLVSPGSRISCSA